MQARGGLQQNQASIPSAPWRYNALLYGRGLSKIAHSQGAPARTGTPCGGSTCDAISSTNWLAVLTQIPPASTSPVAWRCWMRSVSLHPSSFALPHRSRRMDRALRSLFVFDGPVHGLDRGLHVQEPLTGLFGLAALVGTGEHFNKRSPLLDQSRSRLFEIVGVLFAHNCLSRPIPWSALGRNDSLSRRRQADDRAQNSVVSQFEFSGRSRMDRIGGIVGGLEKESLPVISALVLLAAVGFTLVAAYQWAGRLGAFDVTSRELAVRNWQGHVWQGHVWNTVLAILLWLVWFYG